MIRIACSCAGDRERWEISGELSGSDSDALQSLWRQRPSGAGGRLTVDLRSVTFIDEGGARLLARMKADGVELVAAGVDHRHLLATLGPDGCPGVRRQLAPSPKGGR